MSLRLQYYAEHVGSGGRVKKITTGVMVNYSFFSFLNLFSSYSTRLCVPSGSKPYGTLRIRIEIVLSLPLKWDDSIA